MLGRKERCSKRGRVISAPYSLMASGKQWQLVGFSWRNSCFSFVVAVFSKGGLVFRWSEYQIFTVIRKLKCSGNGKMCLRWNQKSLRVVSYCLLNLSFMDNAAPGKIKQPLVTWRMPEFWFEWLKRDYKMRLRFWAVFRCMTLVFPLWRWDQAWEKEEDNSKNQELSLFEFQQNSLFDLL